jgi:hypothetical protein
MLREARIVITGRNERAPIHSKRDGGASEKHFRRRLKSLRVYMLKSTLFMLRCKAKQKHEI